MEDKILIKSERCNAKKVFSFSFIFGIIVFLIMFIFSAMPKLFFLEDEWGKEFYRIRYFNIKCFDWGPLNFWFELAIFILIMLIGVVFYFWLRSYELTITDKRAYGFAAFGKRVDLPVDSISAIGLGWLKSIKITTASGRISFLLIKNRYEIYETISKLIVERQNKETKTETVVKQETSNADELKKYKDLLDGGVITQEEFDAKKKQLLGL